MNDEVKQALDLCGEHWKKGYCAVRVIPTAGHHTGGAIVSLVPRKTLEEAVLTLSNDAKIKPAKMAVALASVQREVTKAVRKSKRLDPSNDRDLMDDLAILMAATMVVGPDVALAFTPIEAIALWVHPDESLPWYERGMLDPVFLEKLGFTQPTETVH